MTCVLDVGMPFFCSLQGCQTDVCVKACHSPPERYMGGPMPHLSHIMVVFVGVWGEGEGGVRCTWGMLEVRCTVVYLPNYGQDLRSMHDCLRNHTGVLASCIQLLGYT